MEDQRMKTFSAKDFSVSEEGYFEAVVATLDSIDHDREIIRSGAIGEKSVLIAGYGHNYGVLPTGVGKLREADGQVRLSASLNMKSGIGRDTYEIIKMVNEADGIEQEFSLGFYPVQTKNEIIDGESIVVFNKIDPFEVSPVMRGASLGTKLIDIKSIQENNFTIPEADWHMLKSRVALLLSEVGRLRQCQMHH